MEVCGENLFSTEVIKTYRYLNISFCEIFFNQIVNGLAAFRCFI